MRNLYKEWWANYIKFYKETQELWELVQQHEPDTKYPVFIEGLRQEWFKEMSQK